MLDWAVLLAACERHAIELQYLTQEFLAEESQRVEDNHRVSLNAIIINQLMNQ